MPVAFDTLNTARELESAGLDSRQAEAITLAMRDAVAEGMSTRADINDVRGDIAQAKTDVEKQIEKARTDLGKEIEKVRTDLGEEIQTIRTDLGKDIEKSRTDLGKDIEKVRTDLSNIMTKADLANFRADFYQALLIQAVAIFVATAVIFGVALALANVFAGQAP